ncbi:8374_t:CDS:1, partial [Scutellospora calospora]
KNNQVEVSETAETLFQKEINKKRRKYKRIILENVVIEDDLFNLFITGLDVENIIIQK